MSNIPPYTVMPPAALKDMTELAAYTPPGCFVEIGVYQGGSAWYLAQIAQTQGRTLHLFDTFSGIPERGAHDREHNTGDFGDTSADRVRAAIPDAVFHVGTFPDTMPKSFEPVAFVHVDCDQYQTCLYAIAAFTPLLVVDGIMLFDDYGCTSGVTKAVDETFGDAFSLTREGKAWIRK